MNIYYWYSNDWILLNEIGAVGGEGEGEEGEGEGEGEGGGDSSSEHTINGSERQGNEGYFIYIEDFIDSLGDVILR